MRHKNQILIVALMGLLLGCETPSTATGKIVPYVAASYDAGLDSSAGDVVVYVSEGKQTGPSIQNAVVTFDGQPVNWVSYGYYYRGSVPPASAGSGHTLRITHSAFEPIEVSLVAPSGNPVAVTIGNPPTDWNAALSTSTEISYTVSPVGGWPSTETVIWANSYDAGYNLVQARPYRPEGSAPVICTFPAGTVYTGFTVRKQTQRSVPGATADSLFRIEGDVPKQYGFDPTTLPPYRANLELTYDGSKWRATASFYDTNYVAMHAPKAVTILGTALSSESISYPA